MDEGENNVNREDVLNEQNQLVFERNQQRLRKRYQKRH
jgi:hypothetical protein